MTAAVDACLPVIRTRGHTLQIRLAPESLFIDADPVRIEQLVTNLINNAVKFTSERGDIHLETKRDGATAVISVQDNGIGLASHMLNTIFNPFTQDDRTLARSSGGLGIGLTIARRLAELHGGSLRIQSEMGEGTAVTIALPATRVGAAAKVA